MKYQQQDKKLLRLAREDSTYVLKTYHTAGRTRQLITKDNKIVVRVFLPEHFPLRIGLGYFTCTKGGHLCTRDLGFTSHPNDVAALSLFPPLWPVQLG